mgnify:CR=1 FL=1
MLFKEVASERRSAAQMPTSAQGPPVITPTVSSMERLQELLVDGQRQEAVDFAIEERLFAHALVIASSMDKEAWRTTVAKFIDREVSMSGGLPQLHGLQVAYSHLSGQGPLSCESACAIEKCTANDRFVLRSKGPVRHKG